MMYFTQLSECTVAFYNLALTLFFIVNKILNLDLKAFKCTA